jgi:acyl carrier protein
MNAEEIRVAALSILKTIAPEIEAGELVSNRPLRQQVDLDSMDWLNFLVALHKQLGVDIPEADYRKLVTLDDLVGYLLGKLRA